MFKDDGTPSTELLEFMVSIRPGRLSRLNGTFQILEWYYPHRFARQQGYRQSLPGSIVSSEDQLNSHTHYPYWLSLTKTCSGASFTIPPPSSNIQLERPDAYVSWWTKGSVAILDSIPVTLLQSSENHNYELLPLAERLSRSSSGSKGKTLKDIPKDNSLKSKDSGRDRPEREKLVSQVPRNNTFEASGHVSLKRPLSSAIVASSPDNAPRRKKTKPVRYQSRGKEVSHNDREEDQVYYH